MRNPKAALVIAACGVALLAINHPTADIRLLTHEGSDPAPHRMQAAVDLGFIGVSVLYTWTVHTLR